MNYKIVVARYNEDISWLNSINKSNVIVYNKGSTINTHFEVKTLPNIGRETYTYLTYIIDHYDNLPNILFFTQGKIEDHPIHFNHNFFELPEGYSKNYINNSFNYGLVNYRLESYKSDYIKKYDLNGKEWFNKYVDNTINLDTTSIIIWYNSIFSVKKEFILTRPLSYYKDLLLQIKGVHPEIAHYFERSWFYIFNCHKHSILDKKPYIYFIGSGLENAIIAEHYATKLNKKVIILEKNNFIGNKYHDCVTDDIIISKSINVLNTDNDEIFNYLNKFGELINYNHNLYYYLNNIISKQNIENNKNKYNVIPKKGYTKLISNILTHPNIVLQFNVNNIDITNIDINIKIFYMDDNISKIDLNSILNDLLDHKINMIQDRLCILTQLNNNMLDKYLNNNYIFTSVSKFNNIEFIIVNSLNLLKTI